MNTAPSEPNARCRQCGAPMGAGTGGGFCARCQAQPQLELSFSAAPPRPPLAVPDFAPPTGFRRMLFLVVAVLILVGGLGWATFQVWPRGPVERAIVAAIRAAPHFQEREGAENPFAACIVDGAGTPVLLDLDGDGRLDLVSGSRKGETTFFPNLGSPTAPHFGAAVSSPFGLVVTDSQNALTFADLNGAGGPDAVNSGVNGAVTYFENHGVTQHPDFVLLAPENDPFAGIVSPTGSYDWHGTLVDLDGDGDSDFVVGTRDGTVLYFENRGTAREPHFEGVAQLAPFGLGGAGSLVHLAFGDLDGDGDLDVVAGNGSGQLVVFTNRGTARHPNFSPPLLDALGLTSGPPEAAPALADVDGDGDLDCVVGAADGHFRYFENLSEPVGSATPPAAPAP